jgi:opacity protein-like surface antigen
MNRWLCIVLALAATLLATACADSGVSPVEPMAKPRLSGGYSVGGNFADTTVVATQSTDTQATLGAEQPETDPSRSGGYSVGGN